MICFFEVCVNAKLHTMFYTLLLLCAFQHVQGSSLVQLANNLHQVNVDENVYELSADLAAEWTHAFHECFTNPLCWVRDQPVAHSLVLSGVAKHAELNDDCLGRVLPDMGYCGRVARMLEAYGKLQKAFEHWKRTWMLFVSSLVITVYLSCTAKVGPVVQFQSAKRNVSTCPFCPRSQSGGKGCPQCQS